jgi:hypothetical protein
MMNSGEPITGIESWFARLAGIAMESSDADRRKARPGRTIAAGQPAAMLSLRRKPFALPCLDAGPTGCLMAPELS